MAYTPCPGAEVGANAVKDCIQPAFEGLKSFAIGIDRNNIDSYVRGATAGTKNHVSALTIKEGKGSFVVEAGGQTAFADTIEEYDGATRKFNKTVTFIAPAHGAGFASNVVEALLQNKDGYVFILQRKDINGDCSYPIIGLEKGATGVTGTLDYNSADTAACYQLSLTEPTVPSGEIDLFDTDYETTKELFESLLAQAY